MMNIDANLRHAASGAGSWSAEAALEAAARLARDTSAEVDWDKGAGERWLRIVGGRHVSALVSVILPLALIETTVISPGDSIQDVIQIFVEDLDGVELSCSPAVLAEVFDLPGQMDVPDPAGFSANDLWYATV